MFGQTRVTLSPGSVLHGVLGPTATVPCYHHQAIDKLAPELTAVGWSDDGGTYVHPVLFARGQVIDLGTANGITNAYPAAINDLDQVVGTVQTSNSPIADVAQTLAALWTPTTSCKVP